ncbi:AAA family ATPase [Fusobacterium periodonticum]|jgi:chaperone protein clpB|uniref:Chaperone protein ClpB n=1 Tax=Fusobacterium periodonticum 1_1_41FAA TaxID=469621 RepID=D6LF54_9FUSO|nr:AAA family ATPase [Fusobacterium periodonticum]EFG28789.1 ATPase family associated with various cellular activities (AAA) [Fusobacterium periodonticum 1_1_41FAA]
MTDKKPKWQKEIESFKGIKSTFIIEGNINDIYPYYDEKDQLNYYNLDSLLIKLFKIEELIVEAVTKLEYNFVFCNPVLGFYNKKSSVPEILKDFDEANNIFKNDGRESYKVDDIEKLSVIIKEALTTKKEKPITIVMNFAARYISSPTSLDSCENNMFINLFEASMNAKAIKGYSNTLILVVEKFNDLPSWFYYNNPNVRTITIPNPDKNIRLDFIEMNYKEELESNLKIKGKFIDNTEGLKNIELKELKNLYERHKKKDENYSLLDALTMYKYGIKENMWESIDDEAVNNLENSLKDRVKGQDKAIKKVSSVIKRAVTGMSGLQHSSTGNKPKGILFFAGPTGTGKTELTKALAEVLFGDENNCIRFDMSEYSESHSDQKLFGAPPGYVGYEAGGQLTNAIKERPFSILLFDEIEKAHPSIMDKFLQILEDGRMTDGQGNTVYFSEALIIFTSNLGITKKIIDSSGNERREMLVSIDESYEDMENKVINGIKAHFKPEVVNRIGNNIVVFDFIRDEVSQLIVKSQIKKINENIEKIKKIKILISPEILEYYYKLAKEKNILEMGGRGIGNMIEDKYINELSDYIFNSRNENGNIIAYIENEKINFKREE